MCLNVDIFCVPLLSFVRPYDLVSWERIVAFPPVPHTWCEPIKSKHGKDFPTCSKRALFLEFYSASDSHDARSWGVLVALRIAVKGNTKQGGQGTGRPTSDIGSVRW